MGGRVRARETSIRVAEKDAVGPGEIGLGFAVADFAVDGLVGEVYGDAGRDGPGDIGVELQSAVRCFFYAGHLSLFAVCEMGVDDDRGTFVAQRVAAFLAESGAVGGCGPHNAFIRCSYRRAMQNFEGYLSRWVFQKASRASRITAGNTLLAGLCMRKLQ